MSQVEYRGQQSSGRWSPPLDWSQMHCSIATASDSMEISPTLDWPTNKNMAEEEEDEELAEEKEVADEPVELLLSSLRM